MYLNKTITALALLLLASLKIYSQTELFTIEAADTFRVNFDNKYELSAVHIIPLSETVQINDHLLNRNEYKLRLSDNTLSLSTELQYSVFDTIIVHYKSYDVGLKKIYQHRQLVKIFDKYQNDSISIAKSNKIDLTSKGIFGKDLKSSGTLLRGFSLGTNKDLTVSSGLRLQLSGKISDEIEIIAALTDENTPIQPEGNTERLEELDKVFIEIKHKNASGVFGDYTYSSNNGEFGKVERKLQGVQGKVNVKNYSGRFAFASSRGKFNSQEIKGIDAVQGPYRLLGKNNENDIIIIAGSEKVYLDGKKLTRGENKDYVIEYSNGELTFTPKILITSLSRIIIDFEYTSRQYERNVLAANASASLFGDKLSIHLNAFQEGDNKNSPIDLSLSENEKDILKQSGDNSFLASTNGATFLEGDSLGIYSSIDTLINGEELTIYKFNPGSENAKYNVTFSFVGEGNGDYLRESIGKFKFVGIGAGAYLPVKFLPLPETNQVGNIVLNYAPNDKINMNVELAANSYDKNTFSELDDGDNNGFARTFKFDLNKIEMNLFKSNLGKFSASYKDRFKGQRFKSIDRINEIEFERNYNTTNSFNNDETLRETKLEYQPLDNISISGQYGFLKKGDTFNTERILSETKLTDYHNIDLNYKYDFAKTEANVINTDWLRQEGRISYKVWRVQPGLEFRSENRKDFTNNKDSLFNTSLNYSEYSPFLLMNISNGFNISAKYTYTDEKVPVNGILVQESKAYAHSYSLNYRDLKELNSSIDFSFRKKKYSEIFKEKGFGDNESIQIRSQHQIKLFDRLIDGTVFYQTSSERSAKLERVFVRVLQGTGSYSYAGDLNNNGIAEENEFVQDPFEGDFILTTVPTDELFPVIDLKVNTRWRIDFAKQFKKNGTLSTILNSLTSETTYRIEENSREKNTEKIYLLNLEHFLNDSTTIRGFNYFQQDVHIFRGKRDLSFRFRFNERKSLNQFSNGLEKSYNNQKSVKIVFRMVKELNSEIEYINENENITAPVSSNRSRNTQSNKLVSDFSYRPYSNFELGFLVSVNRIEDIFPETPTVIDENKISLRMTLSLLQKGRLRIEVERTELLTNTNNNIIPFEITNGNLIGKNYIWRANFDYRFSSNLQTNINYSGRLQGKGKVINTLTAEARAYF